MYSGVVRKVNKNPWKNKTLFSFTLGNEDGYFNTGDKDPGVNEGDSIKFEATPGKREGNFDVAIRSIVKSNDTPVAPEQYAMTTQSTSGAKRSVSVITKDNYWENREGRDLETQKRIEIQAARNAAIALLDAIGTADPGESEEHFINRWTDTFLKNNEERLAK